MIPTALQYPMKTLSSSVTSTKFTVPPGWITESVRLLIAVSGSAITLNSHCDDRSNSNLTELGQLGQYYKGKIVKSPRKKKDRAYR